MLKWRSLGNAGGIYFLVRNTTWRSGERTRLEIMIGAIIVERAVKTPKCIQVPGASMKLAKN